MKKRKFWNWVRDSDTGLPLELAIPFGTVELELVRPHHGDCLLLAFSSALWETFWLSMYCLTIDIGAPPTVEQK